VALNVRRANFYDLELFTPNSLGCVGIGLQIIFGVCSILNGINLLGGVVV